MSDGVTPVRFSSWDLPDRYIRHDGLRARLDANVTELAESQFRFVPGPAGHRTVSLESADRPGYFLRRRGVELWLEESDGSTTFQNAATFVLRPGLAGPAGVSLESYDHPRRYVRHRGHLLCVETADTRAARAGATFRLE